MSPTTRLREDALAIWRAGVAAVDSEKLIADVVHADEETLIVGELSWAIAEFDRIAVVGAGKAGAGMAAALERAFGATLLQKTTGIVNVPADCVRVLERIPLHAARPAGVNEPTEDGVVGANQMLDIVSQLGPKDLCFVLLSGGGSALLPAPVPEITLEDKLAVTRLLMRSGAHINELNCVRKQLSRIKGGGLARACRAGAMVSLIISDVIGDPLDVIASGPTVPDRSTPTEALAILQKYASESEDIPNSVIRYLSRAETDANPFPDNVYNLVIGNNEKALSAAATEAIVRGYQVNSLGSHNAGYARDVGAELARLCRSIRDQAEPVAVPACVLSGGEPVVQLVDTNQPQKGGRNQEVAVAAACVLFADGMDGIIVLSGGTDGEDGPTDAAGGLADADVVSSAKSQQIKPEEFLDANNTYPFLNRTGGLLVTGPTHTNVMDLRVALVR